MRAGKEGMKKVEVYTLLLFDVIQEVSSVTQALRFENLHRRELKEALVWWVQVFHICLPHCACLYKQLSNLLWLCEVFREHYNTDCI